MSILSTLNNNRAASRNNDRSATRTISSVISRPVTGGTTLISPSVNKEHNNNP